MVSLYRDIPVEVYEGLLTVFCMGTILLFPIYGFRNGWRKVAWLLFVEYIFLIYCSTVIFRTYVEGVGHDFTLFWSYVAIQNGQSDLILENIMNVVAFIPIGILLGVVTSRWKMFDGRWKKGWQVALIVGTGLAISISIETLQYICNRGFSEVDDVMHNTIGCLVGGVLVKGSWL